MKLLEPEVGSLIFDNRDDDQSCSQEWFSCEEAASILRVTSNALRIMGVRHIKRYLKGSREYEDICLACNPSKF